MPKAAHLTCPQDSLGVCLLAQFMQPSSSACKECSGAWSKLEHGAIGPAPLSAVHTVSNGLCMGYAMGYAWAMDGSDSKRQQMLLACTPSSFDCH